MPDIAQPFSGNAGLLVLVEDRCVRRNATGQAAKGNGRDYESKDSAKDVHFHVVKDME